MTNRLDGLYPTKIHERLDYKEVDEIVRLYKDSTNDTEKAVHRARLLQAFHKYFQKYVTLLNGTIGSINNSDTMLFLALFLPDSSKSISNYLNICGYIYHVCKHLDDEDIYNELVLMFISLLDKFEFYPEVSFSRYITKYMRWSVKAWIMRIARNPLNKPVEFEPDKMSDDSSVRTKEELDIELELPQLNLGWVFDPSSPLFGVLSKYERFLLYLSYKEDLGVRQISERLGRAKDTIHTHIQQALQKLRDKYEKGEQ